MSAVADAAAAAGLTISEATLKAIEAMPEEAQADLIALAKANAAPSTPSSGDPSPDELKKALLALEQAVQKLNDLEKDVFLEVAAFAKPHAMVRDVGLCVMVLKGSKDVTWMGARAMTADTDFLRSLVEFEISTLTDTQVKHVKAYISKNAVELEALRAISSAGTALLAWVLAIVDYYAVAQGKASSSAEADGAVDYTSSFPSCEEGE